METLIRYRANWWIIKWHLKIFLWKQGIGISFKFVEMKFQILVSFFFFSKRQHTICSPLACWINLDVMPTFNCQPFRLLDSVCLYKWCSSRSISFFRSWLIWIYTVCKGGVYQGSAGPGLTFTTLRVNSAVWSGYTLFAQDCRYYVKIYLLFSSWNNQLTLIMYM